MRLALVCFALGYAASLEAGQCTAHSGPNTTALVELYTSEGCSSCPPADRWLSSLTERGYLPDRVVPIALHVDYWDYIGWKDPYAKRDFSLRSRKLTQLQRLALVHTPQVMVQGRDFRGWGTAAFDEAVAKINATAARARLSLEIVSVERDALAVRASAELLDSSVPEAAALYLAVYEDRLEGRVSRGENRGRAPAHDHVALEWHGPIAFVEPRLVAERRLPVLPRAVAANSGLLGFVQNRRSAEVLQALMLPACP
jgi:hypothetical protein